MRALVKRLILLVLLNVVFLINFDDLLIDYEVKNVYATYSFNVHDIRDRVDELDNVFIGRIDSLSRTLDYDGTGVPIPYSVYNVEVIKEIKGDFDSEFVEVTYFGGKVDNTIYVLDSDTKNEFELLPLIDEIYIFSTKHINNDSGRLDQGANIASVPYSLIWLNSDIDENETVEIYQNEYYSIVSGEDDGIVFDDGGTGGVDNDGSTLSKAIPINSGNTYYKSFRNAVDPIYFKFDLSGENYIDAYSSYGPYESDVKIELLSETNSVLARDDDSGFENNFRLNYKLNSGSYYLKVSKEIYSTGGSLYLNFQTENSCTCENELGDLITGLHSVNITDKVVYKIDGTFLYNSSLNDAIELWSDMNSVEFISHDTTSNDFTLYIKHTTEDNNIAGFWRNDGYTIDNGDEGNGVVPIADLLVLNTIYFTNYSSNQRVRVVAHELGHALGFHEFNKPGAFTDGGNPNISISESWQNIMIQSSLPLQQLGPCDMIVYNYIWD